MLTMSTRKRIRHVRIQGLVPRCDLQSLEHREVELKRDNTMALLCWHHPIILRASELHLIFTSCPAVFGLPQDVWSLENVKHSTMASSSVAEGIPKAVKYSFIDMNQHIKLYQGSPEKETMPRSSQVLILQHQEASSVGSPQLTAREPEKPTEANIKPVHMVSFHATLLTCSPNI